MVKNKLTNFLKGIFMSKDIDTDQSADAVVSSLEASQAIDQAVADQVVSTGVPVAPVIDSSAEVHYYFEGAKVENVLEVLPSGVRFCKMSDGTTKHVPAEIFN